MFLYLIETLLKVIPSVVFKMFRVSRKVSWIFAIVSVCSFQISRGQSADVSQLKKDVQQLKTGVQALIQENISLKKQFDLLSGQCKLVSEGICGPCLCRSDDRLLKKYYCDCRNVITRRDCLDHRDHGLRIDGVYTIHQNHLKTINVYCDQTTDGGGWVVFQRRVDGSVNFYRDWKNYKIGFGQLQKEFWIGNENLFTLSHQALYATGSELRVDMENWTGVKKYAKYNVFQVSNEHAYYQLNIKNYSGTAGNNLMYHNGMSFSTYDQDHDRNSGNCASSYKGGFWFNACHHVNINGRYFGFGESVGNQGLRWLGFHNALKFSEMKLRRKV